MKQLSRCQINAEKTGSLKSICILFQSVSRNQTFNLNNESGKSLTRLLHMLLSVKKYNVTIYPA